MTNGSEFDKKMADLKRLPRAERFEKLITFPTQYTIKVIGLKEGFLAAVQLVLNNQGYQNVIPVERESKKGRYLSITLTVHVSSGQELDRLYSALEQVPGLSHIL